MYAHGLLVTMARDFFIQQLRAVKCGKKRRNTGNLLLPLQLTALLNLWGAWKNISRQCFTHIHVYTLTHSRLTRQWKSHSSLYKERVSKNKCIWTRAVTNNWFKKRLINKNQHLWMNLLNGWFNDKYNFKSHLSPTSGETI